MTEQTDLNEVETTETQPELQEVDIDLDGELIDAETELQIPDEADGEDDAESDDDEDASEDADVLVSNPVRQLRTVNRELVKKLKIEQQEKLRLQKQLESSAQITVDVLPPKPQLSDEDVEYDPEKFEAKLEEWQQKKLKVEQQKRAVEQNNRQAQEAFQAKLQTYEQNKPAYKGIDEAEKAVLSALDVNQQGLAVNYSDDPAFLVWVLGKNPVMLSQLSSITDPIAYAIKLRDIERKAKEKMATTKRTPPPEKVVSGKTAVPSNYQKQIDKLRERGDISASMKLKRELRAKGIDVD